MFCQTSYFNKYLTRKSRKILSFTQSIGVFVQNVQSIFNSRISMHAIKYLKHYNKSEAGDFNTSSPIDISKFTTPAGRETTANVTHGT